MAPCRGVDELSQVPGESSRTHALLSDPGAPVSPGHLGLTDVAFHCTDSVGLRNECHFGAQSHGLRTCCLRFAARVTPAHARLASGWLASLDRAGVVTRRTPVGNFRSRSFQPSRLLGALVPGTNYDRLRESERVRSLAPADHAAPGSPSAPRSRTPTAESCGSAARGSAARRASARRSGPRRPGGA